MIFFWLFMLIANFTLMFGNFMKAVWVGSPFNLFAGAVCGIMFIWSAFIIKVNTE